MKNVSLLRAGSACPGRHRDTTGDPLDALIQQGYRAWRRGRRLHFLETRRAAFLQEIRLYCIESNLVECPPEDDSVNRVGEIADMLDARYPRYARLKR